MSIISFSLANLVQSYTLFVKKPNDLRKNCIITQEEVFLLRNFSAFVLLSQKKCVLLPPI